MEPRKGPPASSSNKSRTSEGREGSGQQLPKAGAHDVPGTLTAVVDRAANGPVRF